MSLTIKVLWMAGTDTFICGVNGKCTIDLLTQIEADIVANELGWSYPECTELYVECSCSPGWYDYGTGYGDVLYWPEEWSYSVLSSKTPEEAESAPTCAEQLKAAIALVRKAAYGYKANFFDRNEFLMHLANIEQQAAV